MSLIDFGFSEKLINASDRVEERYCLDRFRSIDKIGENNQYKVIKAMQKNKISEAHFHGTTGYGYGDIGRDAIENIYADVFGTEDALVRSQFVSGTHAINTAFWSVLRPKDTMISVTGKPYDTLEKAIGIKKSVGGSLAEFGVDYKQVELDSEGKVDFEGLKSCLQNNKIRLAYVQRSKGYTWKPSSNIDEISQIIKFIKKVSPDTICLIDNCYGEFVEEIEPGHAGADLIVGSLIKNPGGGIARTGGYIAGKKEYIELAAYRLTAPGIGKECGSTLGMNREILMGLFFAPHVVAESIKGAVFCASMMENYGYEVSPRVQEVRSDIIQAIKFNNKDALVAFCQGIQKGAAVDSHVIPEPWDMPGYSEQVIMAAGTFVQGASIEVSADAPIREPFIAYMQGGLTYAHAKLSVLFACQELVNRGLIDLKI